MVIRIQRTAHVTKDSNYAGVRYNLFGGTSGVKEDLVLLNATKKPVIGYYQKRKGVEI
jgi:hypothetical protein